MKLIVALCLVAMALAAPPPKISYPPGEVYITQLENENQGDGRYKFAFGLTDGTAQEQEGQVINEGREDETIAVKGSFTWVGPDGVTYRITYTADDNGYQPQIEQGPGGGIPPAVVASLLG